MTIYNQTFWPCDLITNRKTTLIKRNSHKYNKKKVKIVTLNSNYYTFVSIKIATRCPTKIKHEA
jgi:hypothetical protein